jgi:hypothetical protein
VAQRAEQCRPVRLLAAIARTCLIPGACLFPLSEFGSDGDEWDGKGDGEYNIESGMFDEAEDQWFRICPA